jgi:hypothetical protein
VKEFCKVEFADSLACGPLFDPQLEQSPLLFVPDAQEGSGTMIFTSVALDPPEGDVWWEGEGFISPSP